MADVKSTITELVDRLEEDDIVWLINPTFRTIQAWADVTHTDGPAMTHLLASESVLKDADRDFLTGSRLADLVADGILSLRTWNGSANQLLVTETAVHAIVTAGEETTIISATDSDFTSTVSEFYTDHWNKAEPFSLRSPVLTTVQETMEAEFGSTMVTDFMEMLTTSAVPQDGNGLDVEEIVILLAAKHEELLYDISKWGEDAGVASKATFSRVKTRLEEADIIETEKVPIDVGRPRLRLFLTEQKLTDAPITELTWTVEEQLHAAAD